MPCMFAGIRGCGEWIAPIDGCEADCGGPVGGGYENGECCIGGACSRARGWPFRSRLSEGDWFGIGGLSRNCGFDCVDLASVCGQLGSPR